MTELRNLCIIAHVDHGKTTLVDHLLRQAGTFQKHQTLVERVMDSMDLEREKGITILAKNTSIRIKTDKKETKINIVDTPGHADFGGEVERILGMVDGALLLVDAVEGPLPQTRFVLQKALAQGLKVILVINKVDRPECKDGKRIHEVVNQTFDLFVELGASGHQLEFPIVYACAREGWATLDASEIFELIDGRKMGTLQPLFELMLNTLPPPKKILDDGEFRMLVSNLSYSDYVGRLAIGRLLSGNVKMGAKLVRHGLNDSDQPIQENFTVTQLYTFEGLKQIETPELIAGDIGVISGLESFEIGDTLTTQTDLKPLPRIDVERPTLAMFFSINTGPLSGKEGQAIQSRKLKERLLREIRQNVALRFEETQSVDQFRILGRGELQMAILIEQMRREGLEFMVGKPTVLFHTGPNGEKLEPLEQVVMDLPEEHVGDITSLFQTRKGKMHKYEPFAKTDSYSNKQRVRLEFEIPTRGLLGLRSRFLTITRGTGIMSSRLVGHTPYRGTVIHRTNGALVADRSGEAVEYALLNLEDRGVFFIQTGDPVYEGMIIGESNLENDLNVNACREKKLTNIRAAHAEVLVTLQGIRKLSLEQCIEWIDENEWIEVTPKSIRLRKKILNAQHRSVKRIPKDSSYKNK